MVHVVGGIYFEGHCVKAEAKTHDIQAQGLDLKGHGHKRLASMAVVL
jgi:hypothetical protein